MALLPEKIEHPPVAVPSGRLSRLVRLGSLASRVAGGMLAEGTRQIARGTRPQVSSMLLTPANVRRVTDELARLRGAAMKVGQLMSMDAGDLIPPALADILSRLRADAAPMPMSQLIRVLEQEWGPDWENRFSRFSFTPAAAASIGQVHTAVTRDHQQLAIKVQYPGVDTSIDSDVNNVGTLLRLSGLLPAHLDISSLLDEAKKQLHAEADYLQEASWLQHYGTLLETDRNFLLPVTETTLTTPRVLAMSWVDGIAVESLLAKPPMVRDRVATWLFDLVMRELFTFGAMQTDPNFANYRYNETTDQLVLLDFGATRPIPLHLAEGYRRLMQAARRSDRAAMRDAAELIGYFSLDMNADQCERVMDLFQMACEPLCQNEPYDFAASTLPRRMHEAGMNLAMDRDYWHTPPMDALFIHRKLAGIYLLAARLRAQVDIGQVAGPYLN